MTEDLPVLQPLTLGRKYNSSLSLAESEDGIVFDKVEFQIHYVTKVSLYCLADIHISLDKSL
jgi:hypothetical protein